MQYSHLYHGGTHDARLAGLAGSWAPVSQCVNAPAEFGSMSLAVGPPVKVTEEAPPVAIKKATIGKASVWMFDFGRGMSGFVRLNLSSTGVFVGPRQKCGTNNAFDGNTANQTDTYIAQGGAAAASETHTPSFSYKGFRYAQLEGLPANYTPTFSTLTGLFVRSAIAPSGHVKFNESEPELNRLQNAVVHTQLSNAFHHPTDCPQREKRGWSGDAQLSSGQASLNFDKPSCTTTG